MDGFEIRIVFMIDQHQQVSGGAGYAGGFAVGGGQLRQNAQTSGARPNRPLPTVMAQASGS